MSSRNGRGFCLIGLLLGALLAVCTRATAQLDRGTDLWEIEEQPVEVLDCGTDLWEIGGQPVEVVVRWDGATARSGPRQTASDLASLGFADAFVVWDRVGDEWFCVGDFDHNLKGWVHLADLLVPERDSEGRRDFMVREALRHPDTRVLMKAMIRNNLTAKESGNAGILWPHPTRRDGDAQQRAALYAVQYVFDTFEEGGTRYYILGRGPTWSIDTAKEDLTGWIAEDLMFSWRTRVGVQFSSDNPVKLYPRRRDLDLLHKGEEPEPSFISAPNEEWPYDRERYPILDEREDVYMLGAFGSAGNMPPSWFDQTGSDWGALMYASRLIDIVFVIDGTVSVQPAFKEVRNAVSQVRNRGVLSDARYAVTMFKDGQSGYPTFAGGLTASQLDSELQGLMLRAGPDPGDTDLEEAVLEGVIHALHEMRAKNLWRKNSIRALILVGDHGDHQGGGHQGRMDEVLHLLNADRALFFAYQTQNTRSYVAEGVEAYEAFQRDAKGIFDGMAELFPDRTPLALNDAASIASALLKVREFSGEVREGLLIETSGKTAPARIGPYIRRLLRDNDYPEEALRKWGSLLQVTDVGWALASQGGGEVFEKRLRISKRDLESLKSALERLMDDLSHPDRCLKAMFRAMEVATGDRPTPGESPRDFIKKKLGIEMKSDLLKLTFDALCSELTRSKKSREELRAALERSVTLLDGVLYERRVLDSGKGVVLGSRDKVKRWLKVLPDGTTVAWIPEDYIP